MTKRVQKQWITHRWHKESRYYEAHLKRDLFGWVIVRNWGGIDKQTGSKMTKPVKSYSQGLAELTKIKATRKYRQYQLIN